MAKECAASAEDNHRLAHGQFQTIWFLLLGGLVLVLILPFIIQQLDDFLSKDRKLAPAIVEDAIAVDTSLKGIQTNQNADRDAVTSRLDELISQRGEARSQAAGIEQDLSRILSTPLSTWDEIGPYRYEEIDVQLHRRLENGTIAGLAWDMNSSPAEAQFIEWKNGIGEAFPLPFPVSGEEDTRFAAISETGAGDLIVGLNTGFKSGKPVFHITRRTSDGWEEIHTAPGRLRNIEALQSGEVFAFGSNKISETTDRPILVQVFGLGKPKPVQDALNLMPANSMVTALLQRQDGALLVYGSTLPLGSRTRKRFIVERSPTGVWSLADSPAALENISQYGDQSPTQLVVGNSMPEPGSRPLILAITSNFQGTNRLLSSIDGIDWQRLPGQFPTEVSALTYSEKYGFIAAGIVTTKDQKSPRVWVSKDALEWVALDYEQYGSNLDTPLALLTTMASGEILATGRQGNFVSFSVEDNQDASIAERIRDGSFNTPDLSPPGTSEALRDLENHHRDIDSVTPLIEDQEKIVARANAYSETLAASITQYDEVRAALDQSLRNNELTRQITQTATRVAVIGMLIYLVQIVVNRYRYLQRLASFYQARAQALHILADQADQTLLKGITISDLATLLSPDSIGFDSAPEAPTQQMVALLQAGIRANKQP
jgi:hypothetical protein